MTNLLYDFDVLQVDTKTGDYLSECIRTEGKDFMSVVRRVERIVKVNQGRAKPGVVFSITRVAQVRPLPRRKVVRKGKGDVS